MRYTITIRPNGTWRIRYLTDGPRTRAGLNADIADYPRLQHAADVFMSDIPPKPPTLRNLLAALFTGRRVAVPGRVEPLVGTYRCDVDDDGNMLIGSRVSA